MKTKFNVGELVYAKTDATWAIGTIVGITINNKREVTYELSCSNSGNKNHFIQEGILKKIGHYSALQSTTPVVKAEPVKVAA